MSPHVAKLMAEYCWFICRNITFIIRFVWGHEKKVYPARLTSTSCTLGASSRCRWFFDCNPKIVSISAALPSHWCRVYNGLYVVAVARRGRSPLYALVIVWPCSWMACRVSCWYTTVIVRHTVGLAASIGIPYIQRRRQRNAISTEYLFCWWFGVAETLDQCKIYTQF